MNRKDQLRKLTETKPVMEVHLSEATVIDPTAHSAPLGWFRHCIVWINGKRWEGDLYEEDEHGEDSSPVVPGQ